MRIRRAEKRDLPVIKEILDQVVQVHHSARPDLFQFGRKYDDEQLEALINNEIRPIFVAVDDGERPMGYIFCIYIEHPADRVLTPIRTLYIDDFGVDERLRGHGVVEALFDHACYIARKNGCYNLTLNVWSCNEAAMEFYEKVGLVPQKVGLEKIL